MSGSVQGFDETFEPTRLITTTGNVTQLPGDRLIKIMTTTIAAAVGVNLLTSPGVGSTIRIKDGGSAATYNITITPASGNIDGASTAVINTNYGHTYLHFDGTNWGQI